MLALHILVSGKVLAETDVEEARAHYDKAVQYVAEGSFPAASIELRNALQLDPANLDARLLLGDVYLLLGDGEAAEAALKEAERRGANPDRVVAPLGRALVLQGRFAEVLAGFTPEGHEPAVASELRLLQAEAQLGVGQLSEARATYEKLGRDTLGDARIPMGLARIDLAEGKFDEADGHAAAALRLNPDLPEALLLQGEARREKGDLEGSVRAYRDALDGRRLPFGARVKAHVGLATVLINLNRIEEAEAQLLALRRTVPDLPHAAYLAALLKVRAHDFAGARSILEKYSRRLQEVAPAQFLFGIVHYAAGDFETARYWLTLYLRAAPLDLLARKLLGATLLRLDAFPEAVEALHPALAQAPDDPQVLLLLGNANLRVGNTSEAADLLQRAAEFAPSDPRVLRQLAITQIATGQDKNAMAALSTTLDLGANADLADYGLAFSHLRVGEVEAALEVARRLPDKGIRAIVEGTAYMALGRVDEARDAFETALEFDPNFATARLGLAALMAGAGDLDGAEARYLEVLERDKENVLALIGLAGIEHRRGNDSASQAWFKKAFAADPKAVTPAIGLAESYAATGDVPAALELLQSLARSHPKNMQVLLNLGRHQIAAGQYDSATDTYQLLVEASGGAADARLLLARSHLAAGDSGAARRVLEESLAVHPQYSPTADALIRLVEKAEGREAGLAYAKHLQEQYPEAGWIDQLIGGLHWRAGRFEAALQAYEDGWAKSPSAALAIAVSEARMQRAGLTHKPDTAILAPLEEWLLENPADDTVRLALANAQMTLGDLAAARESYEALSVSQAGNSVVWNNLAWILQQAGDPRAAVYGERALALAPDDVEVMDTVGWILLEDGQTERATKLLQEAHEAAPDNPNIAFHYAAALNRSGNTDGAKRVLQALLQGSEAFPTRSEAEALLGTLRQ